MVFFKNVLLHVLLVLTIMYRYGTYGKAIRSFAGPYISYVDMFSNCDNSASLPVTWHLRTTHFNPRKPYELQIATGNLSSTTIGLTDKHWLRATMDTRSNNEWKENAFIFDFKDKACSTFQKHIPGFFNLFFGKSMKGRSSCIIEAGLYEVNQKPINWTMPYFPIMPYGHYRMHLKIGESSTTTVCGVIECHLIPKS